MKVNQLGKYFRMDRITLFVPFWFFEILFIGEFKPKLNKQSDLMGAKVFTTTSVMPVGCSDHWATILVNWVAQLGSALRKLSCYHCKLLITFSPILSDVKYMHTGLKSVCVFSPWSYCTQWCGFWNIFASQEKY